MFGIEDFISKATKVEQANKQLQQKQRTLEKEIEQLYKDIQKVPNEPIAQIAYQSLADNNPKWNQQDLGFRGPKSDALFEQLNYKIDGIRALYEHREDFYLYQDLKAFGEIADEQKAYAILAWKVLGESPDVIESLRTKASLLQFLTEQQKLIDAQKFVDVNWSQLCEVLERPSLCEIFMELVGKIKLTSANQKDLNKSLSSLKQVREQLRQGSKASGLFNNGQCPYCGQNWNKDSILEDQFTKTQELINSVLGREFVEYTFAIDNCRELFEKQCMRQLDYIFSDLKRDILLQLYLCFPNWQAFKTNAAKCAPVMSRLRIHYSQIKLEGSLQDAVQFILPIVTQCAALKGYISAAYYELSQKYRFAELYNDSFKDRCTLEGLSLTALDQKKEYIANQYYRSFDESMTQLHILLEQKKELAILCTQMKIYSGALKNAIKSYQQLIIGQIEIPFFLYSSRLLQSYQGGQGVLINSDGKNVRFSAPGSEHDVLYTMSSGQLSAVLLAFSLSLNKIYAGDLFQTILIDDPIQCMDDINMISFVELLRREFSMAQIILSTHEDTFSNYICYKFQKYGLSQQTITLKNS